MSTTAQNMQELLPPAEPQAPQPQTPQLAAPPGVTVNQPSQATPAELAPASTKSVVDPLETTRGQITELLAANSPYLTQARDRATQVAAARGLQNSSIAAQSGEQAAISAALPIASDTAATYNQRALANQNVETQFGLLKQQGTQASQLQAEAGTIQSNLQKQQTEAASRLQSENAAQRLIEQAKAGDIAAQQQLAQFGFNTQLSAQENIQRLQQLAAQGDLDAKARLENFQNATALQAQQQQGAQTLQQRELANQQWMAQFDAATQKELQSVDLATRERMQAEGLNAQQAMQQVEVKNQQWLAQFDATTREKLQGLDADVRQAMQQLDLASQQRIADMNVAASERSDAARMATTLETTYSTMLATIANNPDIPADVRQTYIDHANAVRDSNLALVEQMFGIDLQW